MKAPSITSLSLAAALLLWFGETASIAAGVRIDPDFSPTIDGNVASIAILEHGAILVGGEFGAVNGTPRANLARLSPNGSLDAGFSAQADGPVAAVLAWDGSMAVGGRFSRISGTVAPNLAILDGDGEVAWGGAQGGVECLASGNGLWAGGAIQSVQGQDRRYVAGWGAEGGLDAAFVPALLPSWAIEAGVSAIAAQPDGKLILGGVFNTSAGPASLVRLNADGSVDGTFGGDCGSLLYVRAIRILGDGRVLIGGQDRDGKGFVRRLNSNRSLDPTFQPMRADRPVHALAIDAQGRILAGGAFGLARLGEDGSLDPGWTTELEGVVNTVAIDGQNRVLAGGMLKVSNGWTGLVRLIDGTRLKALATNGAFRATLGGVAGRTYAVEASENLRDWEEISLSVAGENGIAISDDIASARRHRFFRARLVQ